MNNAYIKAAEFPRLSTSRVVVQRRTMLGAE